MHTLKRWFYLTVVLLWHLTICSSQNKAIPHLNLKFNRLSRITNGLQRDVEDIWTALSNTVMDDRSKGKVDQYNNETRRGYPNSEEILILVNGTVSDVKELKGEVEELMVYAHNGLKNEKAFSRKILKEMQASQIEHESKTSSDIAEMKIWRQNFEQQQRQILEDKFHIFTTKTENDDRNLMEKVENMTKKCVTKLKQNAEDSQAPLNDNLETIKQNFTSMEENVTDAVSFAKQEIFEMQGEQLREALTCEVPWETFGDSCYFFSSVAMGWDDAWEHCSSKGSYLLEIDNADEINYLVQKYEAELHIWVGGNDKDTEGTFVWQTSKKTIPADYFYPGEPNDSGGEDCAQLYCHRERVGKLNDDDCAKQIKFVCEKSKFIFQ